MTNIHDMGGRHGFGAIVSKLDDQPFHTHWEARVFALTLAVGAWGRWNVDATRHQRELIPAPAYLRMTYYERWLTALVEQIINAGLATRAELMHGTSAPGAAKLVPALIADRVGDMLARRRLAVRATERSARFAVGAHVRARNFEPVGHTRAPRYVRGKQGEVVRLHGAHVLPDSNAHGRGGRPEPLYNVRFAARELWGDTANARDGVHLDLWESYLEPA